MKKLLLTMITLAVLASCDKKEKEAAKDDAKKVGKTVEEVITKAADKTEKAVKDIANHLKEYKTKTGKIFEIKKEGEGSLQTVTITPKGFEYSEPYTLKDIDPISKVFMADMNKDGFEEIYIVTTGAGSGSYANLYGYITHNDKSVTPIYFPEISKKELSGVFKGYMGHDTFYVKNGNLYRKFPIYKDSDSNAKPTGGDKIVQYVLKAGEATWTLVPKK